MARLPSTREGSGSAGDRLFALARSLRDAGDGEVWIREFELRNP
jgi:hypothetical protein